MGKAASESSCVDALNPCLTFQYQGHVSGQCQTKGKVVYSLIFRISHYEIRNSSGLLVSFSPSPIPLAS